MPGLKFFIFRLINVNFNTASRPTFVRRIVISSLIAMLEAPIADTAALRSKWDINRYNYGRIFNYG